MSKTYAELAKLQELIMDIQKINRNHFIPSTETRENVVEHSFSVAMLCWKMYEELKPDLDLQKIFSYALAHDFIERGLGSDVSTYASKNEREVKKEHESKELVKLTEEFPDFPAMTKAMGDYDNMADEEARFVWSIDKMQAIVLGEMDGWRPYAERKIPYADFCAKCEGFLEKCPSCLKETFKQVNEHSRRTYYDQPEK